MKHQWFQTIFGNTWKGSRTKRGRLGRSASRQRGLQLEALEPRDVPTVNVAPFVTSVSPGTNQGSTTEAVTQVVVQFSEDVSGANDPANYVLFDSTGARQRINGVSYGLLANGHGQAIVNVSNPVGGTLAVEKYTLYLRGNNILGKDDSPPIPLAGNGSVAFTDAGAGTFSLINVPGDVSVPNGLGTTYSANFQSTVNNVQTGNGPLEAQSNFPASGGRATVTRIADLHDVARVSGDDGIRDLVVASTGFIDVYAGKPTGGFEPSPTFTIPLATNGGALPVPTDVDIADMNGDGRSDIVVTCAPNRPGNPNGTVQVILNQTGLDLFNRPVDITFGGAVSHDTGRSPVAAVVGDFDGDGNLDVITVNAALNGNVWDASYLPGNGGGQFTAETDFQIGTTQPSNPNLTQLVSTPTDVVAVHSTTSPDHNTGTIARPVSDLIFSSTTQLLYIENISTPGAFSIRRPLVGPNGAEDGLFGTGGNSIEMEDPTAFGLQPNLIVATPFGIDRYTGAFPVGAGSTPTAVVTGLANPTNLMIGNDVYGVLAGAASGSQFAVTTSSRFLQVFDGAATNDRISITDLGSGINGGIFSTTHALDFGYTNGDTAYNPIVSDIASPLIFGVATITKGVKQGLGAGAQNANGTYQTATNVTAGGLTPQDLEQTDLTGDARPDLFFVNHDSSSVSVRIAVGDAATILTANAGPNDGTITVESVGYFPAAPFDVLVDSELMQVIAVNTSAANPSYFDLTVNRGAQGTVVAAHQATSRVQLATYLTAAITGTLATTIRAHSVAGFPINTPNFQIQIDTEVMTVTNVTPSGMDFVLTVLRGGVNGTPPTTHALNAPITFLPYTAPFTSSTLNSAQNRGLAPSSVTAAVLTGGGPKDLVVVSQVDSSVVVLKNVGLGQYQFATATPIAPVPVQPTKVIIGDLNRDGFPDAVVTYAGAGTQTRGVSVLFGNGDRTFKQAVQYLQGVNASNVAFIDANNDGFLDLVVTEDAAPGHVYILLNDGFGHFTLNATYDTVRNPVALAIGDVNGDGYQDIVTGAGVLPTDGPEILGSVLLTKDNIGVLLNNVNGSFLDSQTSTIARGTVVNSLALTHLEHLPRLNGDNSANPYPESNAGTQQRLAFPDLVVGLGQGSVSSLVSMTGFGDGTFINPVPYSGRPDSFGSPSSVVTTSDPLVNLTTFQSGGTSGGTTGRSSNVNLMANGNFQLRDLTGQNNSLLGWQSFSQENSRGSFNTATGLRSDQSSERILRNEGRQAVADEQDLIPLNYTNFIQSVTTRFDPPTASAGTHILYQDVTIPANATNIVLSFQLYYENFAPVTAQRLGGFTDPFANPSLDYSNFSNPNQQIRVDIMSPDAPITAVNPDDPGGHIPGVIQNLIQTTGSSAGTLIDGVGDNDTRFEKLLRNSTYTKQLPLSYAGKTIRLRFAQVNNQGQLITVIDNVSLQVAFNDIAPPAFAPQPIGLQLRNPGFPAGPLQLPTTSDPTVIGRVSDNGGVNNLAFVEAKWQGTGTNSQFSYDFRTSRFDAQGNWALTPPTELNPGPYHVTATVMDKAGNSSVLTLDMVVAGKSTTIWQAVGPGPIDVTANGTDYTQVSGQINETVLDPSDPTGNTMYVGSQGGGVWKTTNGGQSWTPLMSFLIDGSTGQQILDRNGNPLTQLQIGGLAISRSNPQILYAATGSGDVTATAAGGVGVLKTTNGGRSWSLAGNSGSVLFGARVTKLAVDGNNPNRVYVAVAGFSDPNGQPIAGKGAGVYKSDDGGLTWTNVFVPTGINLFYPDGTGVPVGTTMASVTDLVIDPFNNNAITIGVGNLGLTGAANDTGGVWTSADFGLTWRLQVAGNDPQIGGGTGNNFLPGGPANHRPASDPKGTGSQVGRVTVAQGSGRLADVSTFYVLIGAPPPATIPTPNPGSQLPVGQQGGFFDTGTGRGVTAGLYKTKDSFQNMTRVLIRVNSPTPTLQHNFVDIDLLGSESGSVGALVVDPANANIVYVGGSQRYQSPYVTETAQPDGGGALAVTRGRPEDNHPEQEISVSAENAPQPGAGQTPGVDYTRESLIRVDTGNMRDSTYHDPWSFLSGPAVPNDGDDIDKFATGREWETTPEEGIELPEQFARQFGTRFYEGAFTPYPTEESALYGNPGTRGEGVTWYDLLSDGRQATQDASNIPGSVKSLVIDPEGRLIVGSKSGIYRGVQRGFGYDFTSGAGAIQQVENQVTNVDFTFGPFGGHVEPFNLPVGTGPRPLPVDWASLNGNLQINETNSLAIDPQDPNRIYTAATDTGLTVTDGPLNSVASGGQTLHFAVGNLLTNVLEGPTVIVNGAYRNVLNPDGVAIRAAVPDPNNPAGTLSNVYAAFANQTNIQGPNSPFTGLPVTYAKAPVFSFNSGGQVGSYQPESAGINLEDASMAYPVLEINPHKVLQNGVLQDQLLYGTDRLYITTTDSNRWQDLVKHPLSANGGMVTAAAFAPFTAPSAGAFYVGTNLGEVFVDLNGGLDNFPERDSGLPSAKVTAIGTDPFDNRIAFVGMGSTGGRISHLFQTQNGGVEWIDVSGGLSQPANKRLPDAAINKVIYDRRLGSNGQPDAIGTLYVATDVGVYTSTDAGVTWSKLGQGLPNAPVVDMQLDLKDNLLAVALRGRGVYQISIDHTGPKVINVNPLGPIGPGINKLTITFDEPVRANTFTVADVAITGPGGGVVTPLAVTPTDATDTVFTITFAGQLADGTYNVSIGPQIEDQVDVSGSTTFVGNTMSAPFTFRFVVNSTDDGRFVTGLYHDVLGRSAETDGFIFQTGAIDALRNDALGTVSTGIVHSEEFRDKLVVANYQQYLGRAPSQVDINFWAAQLGVGLPREQFQASLAGSLEYFTNANAPLLPPQINENSPQQRDAWLQALYQTVLGRTIDGTGRAGWLAALSSGVTRTQVALDVLTSTEYRDKFVNQSYLQVLGRAAGPAEQAFYANQMANGLTDEQLLVALASSQEFFLDQKAGNGLSTVTTWVQAVFTHLLGRAASAADVTAYTATLLNSFIAPRQQLALNFLSSPEYRNNAVNALYQKYLHRSASAAEQAFYTNTVANGATFEDVAQALVSSDEYFQLQGGDNLGFLQALFPDVLGRQMTLTEQQQYLAVLQASPGVAGRAQVAHALLTGTEYRTNLVASYYQNYLRRAGSPSELSFWVAQMAQGVRDEQVLATILSSQEYFILRSTTLISFP